MKNANAKYIVTRTTYYGGRLTRTAYGIALVERVDGVLVVLEEFCDLSCRKKDVVRLVDRCNRYELSPIQLDDVVQDFLALSVP